MMHPIEMFNLTFETVENILDDPAVWNYCYEYYLPGMPYGTAKARDGDPDEWICQKLDEDLIFFMNKAKKDMYIN